MCSWNEQNVTEILSWKGVLGETWKSVLFGEKYTREMTDITHLKRSRGSSDIAVSDYGLDDRAIEVRSQAEGRDFSSVLSPERLWGPRSLLYNGYREFFPRE
jgi:hypothetical protein